MGGPIELERKKFWTCGQKKLLSIIHTYLILWVTRGKNWNILLLDLCSTSVLQITTSKMVTYVFYIQSHPPVRIFFLFFFIFKGYVLCCKNSLIHDTFPTFAAAANGKQQQNLVNIYCRHHVIRPSNQRSGDIAI